MLGLGQIKSNGRVWRGSDDTGRDGGMLGLGQIESNGRVMERVW